MDVLGSLNGSMDMPDLDELTAEEERQFHNIRHTPLTITSVALLRFISPSYWSRLWIIQEFFLAPKLDMMFGDKCIDGAFLELTDIDHMVDWLPDLASQLRLRRFHILTGLRYVPIINGVDILQENRKKTGWTDVLALSESVKCSEIRDRIFGGLGLC
jgi:hypothetical protein